MKEPDPLSWTPRSGFGFTDLSGGRLGLVIGILFRTLRAVSSWGNCGGIGVVKPFNAFKHSVGNSIRVSSVPDFGPMIYMDPDVTR